MLTVTIALYAAASGLFAVCALSDFQHRRIPNSYVIALATIGLACLISSTAAGPLPWSEAGWRLLIVAGLFAAGCLLFAAGGVGGGDVKLVAASGLLTPAVLLGPFLTLMALAGGVISIVVMLADRLKPTRQFAGEVPYGIAIAAAGIWVCFHQVSVGWEAG